MGERGYTSRYGSSALGNMFGGMNEGLVAHIEGLKRGVSHGISATDGSVSSNAMMY